MIIRIAIAQAGNIKAPWGFCDVSANFYDLQNTSHRLRRPIKQATSICTANSINVLTVYITHIHVFSLRYIYTPILFVKQSIKNSLAIGLNTAVVRAFARLLSAVRSHAEECEQLIRVRQTNITTISLSVMVDSTSQSQWTASLDVCLPLSMGRGNFR